jgi:hypothetical protein
LNDGISLILRDKNPSNVELAQDGGKMKKLQRRLSADEYVESFAGWRRIYGESLRSKALAIQNIDETVKWGHLVYQFNGPAFLIRVE